MIIQISVVDFYPDQVSREAVEQRHAYLEKRYEDLTVHSITVSFPLDLKNWDAHESLRDPVAREVNERLAKILGEHPGQVRMLILDTPGDGRYLTPLGHLADYEPGASVPALPRVFTPLEGRLAEDATVVSLAGKTFSEDEPAAAQWVVHLLHRLGATRGSYFGLATYRSPLPGFRMKAPSDAAFLGSTLIGLTLAATVGGSPDLYALAPSAIAAAGVLAAFKFTVPKSKWKVHKFVPSYARTRPWRTVSARAAATAGAAILAGSSGNLGFLAQSLAIGATAYLQFAITGYVLERLNTRSLVRDGSLDVGRRITVDGTRIIGSEALRMKRDYDQIFDCANRLAETES